MTRRIGAWLFCQHIRHQQNPAPCDHIRKQEQFGCHITPKITPLIHNSLPLSVNSLRDHVDDRHEYDRPNRPAGQILSQSLMTTFLDHCSNDDAVHLTLPFAALAGGDPGTRARFRLG